MMQVLRNTWYVAAWPKEIGPRTLLGRTILNEPVLMYRKADGTPVAIGTPVRTALRPCTWVSTWAMWCSAATTAWSSARTAVAAGTRTATGSSPRTRRCPPTRSSSGTR